jgi:hypothetical protein
LSARAASRGAPVGRRSGRGLRRSAVRVLSWAPAGLSSRDGRQQGIAIHSIIPFSFMFLRARRRAGLSQSHCPAVFPGYGAWRIRKALEWIPIPGDRIPRRSATLPHARPEPANSIQAPRRFPPLSLDLLTAPNESECRFLDCTGMLAKANTRMRSACRASHYRRPICVTPLLQAAAFTACNTAIPSLPGWSIVGRRPTWA